MYSLIQLFRQLKMMSAPDFADVTVRPLRRDREAVTISVAFGDTSSIKEEEGGYGGRFACLPPLP